MTSFAADMVDSLFASALTEDVTYTPAAGGSHSVRAVPVTVDEEANAGRFNPGSRRQARAYEFRTADIPAPVSNDTMEHAGITYQLQSNGYHPDGDNLIWRVECYAV